MLIILAEPFQQEPAENDEEVSDQRKEEYSDFAESDN